MVYKLRDMVYGYSMLKYSMINDSFKILKAVQEGVRFRLRGARVGALSIHLPGRPFLF